VNDAFGPNPSFGDQKLRSPSAMLRPSTLVALLGEARFTLLCDFDVDVSHLILLGRVMSERRRSGVSERMSPCPPIVPLAGVCIHLVRSTCPPIAHPETSAIERRRPMHPRSRRRKETWRAELRETS
jgi:hypothetical protein